MKSMGENKLHLFELTGDEWMDLTTQKRGLNWANIESGAFKDACRVRTIFLRLLGNTYSASRPLHNRIMLGSMKLPAMVSYSVRLVTTLRAKKEALFLHMLGGLNLF